MSRACSIPIPPTGEGEGAGLDYGYEERDQKIGHLEETPYPSSPSISIPNEPMNNSGNGFVYPAKGTKGETGCILR
jgi:hypothetical protein